MVQPPNEDALIVHQDSQQLIEIGRPDEQSDPDKERPISRSRTIAEAPTEEMQSCHLTAAERKMSRSLSGIYQLHSLTTDGTKVGEQLLFLWSLGRMSLTRILTAEFDDPLPGCTVHSVLSWHNKLKAMRLGTYHSYHLLQQILELLKRP